MLLKAAPLDYHLWVWGGGGVYSPHQCPKMLQPRVLFGVFRAQPAGRVPCCKCSISVEQNWM